MKREFHADANSGPWTNQPPCPQMATPLQGLSQQQVPGLDLLGARPVLRPRGHRLLPQPTLVQPCPAASAVSHSPPFTRFSRLPGPSWGGGGGTGLRFSQFLVPAADPEASKPCSEGFVLAEPHHHSKAPSLSLQDELLTWLVPLPRATAARSTSKLAASTAFSSSPPRGSRSTGWLCGGEIPRLHQRSGSPQKLLPLIPRLLAAEAPPCMGPGQ